MKQMHSLCGIVLVVLATVAQGSEYDHDLVKRLREAGEIVALEQITQDVRKRYPGRIIEVEFERKYGRYVYEIGVLDKHGDYREYYYDATDGRFLEEEKEESHESLDH